MKGNFSVFSLTMLMLSVVTIPFGCKKAETKRAIGDSFQGGKVFYVDNTGLHGLVVAAADISAGSPWGCKDTELAGADGTANGTGNQNTQDILKSCTEAGTAAKICSDLVLEGFSDWYLPSKDELALLYEQRATIGGFAKDTYWSSSEVSKYSAWLRDFDTGTWYTTTAKDWGASVRAVRSF